jgi:hypothetical protein
MNGRIALSHYLWTELWARWRAQPASPLARLLLTFALAVTATVFFAGFAAAEEARTRELERLGVDTIVWRMPSTSVLQEGASVPPDHWAASLGEQGHLLLLQQLPTHASNPWMQPLPAMVAPMGLLRSLIPAGEYGEVAAVWFTRAMPPGRRGTVQLDGVSIAVVTRQPEGRWRAVGLDDFVLIPPAQAAGTASGRLDVVMFTPAKEATGAEAVRSVRGLFAAEGLDEGVVQDPSGLREALAIFSRGQTQWRLGMMAALGGCVLLMYASLGMLEERQTRFVQALLRSLGVSAGVLWLASLLENAVVANAALALAVLAGEASAGSLLSFAGLTGFYTGFLPPSAVISLACAVNAGVLLSLFPLARALRRPVGAVLP